MPTGYTAGIVDGSIKTFPEFAKLCMRAFGATVHMRDEDMNMEYIPREPSKYHTEELQKAVDAKALAIAMTDNEIIGKATADLLESKSYHQKRIEEIKKVSDRLNAFLAQAGKYEAPTVDHKGVRDFMIEQLTSTIEHDGNSDYHYEELKKIENKFIKIDVVKVREVMIADADQSILYHTKELAEEQTRCDNSNKWVEQFLASLK